MPAPARLAGSAIASAPPRPLGEILTDVRRAATGGRGVDLALDPVGGGVTMRKRPLLQSIVVGRPPTGGPRFLKSPRSVRRTRRPGT